MTSLKEPIQTQGHARIKRAQNKPLSGSANTSKATAKLSFVGVVALLASAAIFADSSGPRSDEYPTQVWFGDTHVHTGWSADAGMDGAILTPADAYRFALGEEITTNSGLKAKLKRPYDWFMVTDHSDGMGVINEIVAKHPEMMKNPILKRWSEAIPQGGEAAADAKSELIVMQSEGTLPQAVMDPKWMTSAWEKTLEAAEKYDQPGRFTTMIAFEWTVNANGGDNLHRNVIFRDKADKAGQVLPLTTFQTQDPYDLWQWMADYENKTGGQVLAIPHNGNMSNGRMFEEKQFDGSPLTKEWAQLRAKYEPLYELSQIKGQSESHPLLSPDDEFANWDLWDRGNLILKPKPENSFQYEYWREALKSGMRLKSELGVNPFLYGADGGTDTHTGLSTADEDNFFGKFKTLEPRKDRWNFPLLSGPTDSYAGWEQAASGVTGVWARENTRTAIWDALKRKETYATTGPRIQLRFFGGFNFVAEDLGNNMIQRGYRKGVPMGGMLSKASGQQAPTFIVAAMKDPDGANLDRVQIVKGWLSDDGKTHEKIYDVKWSGDRKRGANGKLPPVGNTVNLETAEYTNSIGATELIGVFKDPDFEAQQQAFYYVRVLEIPTPRWTLYDKVRFGSAMSDEVPLVHQERAFSSPIWYTP
ncbi:DUF3604 domain-containing protein [Aestuariicella hydrocarbonica]|uniref:DUF3604 domain-containing protein n=1 Tax=Pseudomaricurvus hydrocarbonicus TaxID=1470433 RepID=A0A9E5MNK7_9GAMM|nr:DUF3604 domain-containing protein [Aestuariicella hydrocarbonica]NHO67499.1 DUF3604 domain-containing protein [Aestuariicella hydrocarbonica]